jgi:NAD(P)-dependent dehydrogenase (short-subunit alcohol dehydrogenase family)
MRLANKTALITGAGSGIGRAIACRFASEGARLMLCDIAEEGLRETVGQIEQAGGEAFTVLGDVAQRPDADRMVEAAVARLGRLEIVINNAGIAGSQQATLAHLTPDEDWERVIGVNLSGVFWIARAAVRHMLEHDGGVIVNTASVAGLVPFPGRAAYNASKGGVVALTRALALDYAPNHIRVNALCPGLIETNMTRWRLEIPELRQQVLSATPWGRVGQAGDIAAAALYLASDESDFMTGQMLVVDGGWSIK